MKYGSGGGLSDGAEYSGSGLSDVTWSAQKLREFMGMKYIWRDQDLGFRPEAHTHYFILVRDIGLLPFGRETLSAWNTRVKKYEQLAEVCD